MSTISYPLTPVMFSPNFAPRAQLKKKRTSPLPPKPSGSSSSSSKVLQSATYHKRQMRKERGLDSFSSSAPKVASPDRSPGPLDVSGVPFLLYFQRFSKGVEQSTVTSSSKLVVLYATPVEDEESGAAARKPPAPFGLPKPKLWRVTGSKIPVSFADDQTEELGFQLAYVADSGVQFLDNLKCSISVHKLKKQHTMRLVNLDDALLDDQQREDSALPTSIMTLSLVKTGASSVEIQDLEIIFDERIL